MLSKSTVRDLVSDDMFPALTAERENLDRIDRWMRFDHDQPHSPRQATREYKELSGRAQTPWLALVVTAVVQELYVDGYRRADDPDNAGSWRWWQQNGLDRRQLAIHRSACGYGLTYASVLPGTSTLGEPMPIVRGHSPRRMIAFYESPESDDWPAYALEAEPAKIDGSDGWSARLFDDEAVHYLQIDQSGAITYLEFREHPAGVCPVIRFANQLDLEGRATGEVEPFIPVAARVDQTVFDRLVVQRFSSWVVRTIAGMTKPDSDEAAEAERLRLRVEDLLVAEDPDTKFGSLPATPLDGFIKAAEADIQALGAVSQTPAHELLGQMVNLSAEALVAARASLNRKVEERKHSYGQSWEQTLRLGSRIMGDGDGARDMESQVRWRDMEGRSLGQAADALGKLATMLGVPVEMLWERIPGWTQQDVERAKNIASQAGGMQSLLAEALGTTESDDGDFKDAANALGQLIRAGADPEDAARRVGLSGLRFTGATPVSLRPTEAQARSLED